MSAIVGIDIGTTNIKVIAFSKEGKTILALNKKNIIYKSNGYFDLDGEYILQEVSIMSYWTGVYLSQVK